MNTTKHTPGPWEGTPQAKGRDYAVTLNVNRQEIGFAVFWGNKSPEQAQANAALIAAAPELLEALKQFTEGDGMNMTDDNLDFCIGAARRAIAKAEGRL